MNSYVTVQIETNSSFWWDFQAKTERQTMCFQSILPSKREIKTLIHRKEWWQWRLWLITLPVALLHPNWWRAPCCCVFGKRPIFFGKGPVFLIVGNGHIVISTPAARPLHSIFHCCLRISCDCCVYFPNAILTKPSTSNNTRLHMDQFLLFSLGPTMPQAE